VSPTTSSEGTSFAQKGGRGTQNNKTYDKEYWKDKECYNCHKYGHPSHHCPDKDSTNNDKDDDDSKSLSSKTSRSSTKSTKGSINKLQKKLKKTFATLSTTQTALTTKIDEMNEESSISDSDDELKSSHFQTGIVLAQQGITLKQDFEQRNANILFKKSGSKLNLDLRNIILLDNESTMDLFCNPSLVHHVRTAKKAMSLQSNGGNMRIKQKATIDGYHKDVWFSKHAITNIIALKNLIQQYIAVTYDSDHQMFVVHRQKDGKSTMYFIMHESGLHYHDPKDAAFSCNINTVYGNLKDYTKRQIDGAQRARTLYATLGYPSIKDFKWVIQSNQIKNCPVTIQDVVAANQIWGKNIAAIKGKAVHQKP
jgi:hypothetical protein